MKKNLITILFFGALILLSTKSYSQQDSSGNLNPGQQVSSQKAQNEATIEDLKDKSDNAREVEKDAEQVERAASDAAKESKSALKAEKKAQKARDKADKQRLKAEKARNKAIE